MTLFKDRPDLMQKYREGEATTLELVYKCYVQDVRRYVGWQAYRAGAGHLARMGFVEELCQEVFLKAFLPSAREAFDGKKAYWPYLKTIAKNAVIDAVRRLDHQVQADPPLPRRAYLPGEPCYMDECLPQMLATVRGYIDTLPTMLTRVYHERFILDHSQEITARNLELSRGQVRGLEQRLRCGLKRRLNACGVYEL